MSRVTTESVTAERRTPEISATAREQRRRARSAARAGLLGNYVDQVDIFLPVIALAPAAAIVLGPEGAAAQTGLIFVATLLGRPLGAAIFGSIADHRGRTSTTKVAIAGIAITTLLIALIPSHDVAGVGTLWMFVALRLIGGIFFGGEYTAAIPLAMEWAQPRRRGCSAAASWRCHRSRTRSSQVSRWCSCRRSASTCTRPGGGACRS
jgi:MFS family permease